MAWLVETADAGITLAAFVKAKTGAAWSVAKKQVETGKVFVDGTAITEIAHRLRGGESIDLRMAAPRPRDPTREGVLVFDDPHVVVIDKPAGISSVPYDDREVGTAMDLVRGAWRRMGKPATSVPLHVVHRIDRATSGLLAFAKTKRAEIEMQAQLRAHTMERMYACVAHGVVHSQRIESYLVGDRGDGLRGSTTRTEQGKRAVTHVRAVETLAHTTRCEVTLETGKTHQIRIHFSEGGHPLVGEPVYIREYTGKLVDAPRMLLHAQTLGFVHPTTGEQVRLRSELPPDFTAVVDRLRVRAP